MPRRHRHANLYANLAGIPYRFCGECGRIQRLFAYKSGWETFPGERGDDPSLSCPEVTRAQYLAGAIIGYVGTSREWTLKGIKEDQCSAGKL